METTAETTFALDHAYRLTHKPIGEIRGHFVVPRYQRGYRWDKGDVTRLLDDIWGSKGELYSLQPIVVKLDELGKSETENKWELIDGQQRLTTLFLIFHYIQQQGWKKTGAPYSLEYKTRPGSQNYLNTLDRSLHNTNIDYWHLYRAHRRIAAWFRKHGDAFAQENAASTVHHYLFKSVRVIWYEAPDTTDATALFTRLNVGRIPLTDAELIKAALLSAVCRDRRLEIAAQWDGIERDLHRDDIWSFVAGLTAGDGDEQFPTRISLLLDTLADAKAKPKPGKRPRYYTFDALRGEIKLDFSKFWKQVVALHAQILGWAWADQPNIYNKIGFLVASGDDFGEIVRASKGMKKSEFEASLVDRIRKHVRVKDGDLEELSYDEKKRDYPKILQLLLLMNVETTTQSGLRFPFSLHIGHTWSLEHIHAQNAEKLNRAEQWRTWLTSHKLGLCAIASDLNQDDIEQLKKEIDAAVASIDAGKAGNFSGETFNALSSRVLKVLNRDEGPDHTIRNMALLSSDDNSRLSNSVFEVKRQMILELDREGRYVPVCTRNVFLKYYSEADAQQPHFWSEVDKDSYLKELRKRLKPYLNELNQNAGSTQ